jgi:hypothetical protein
MGGSLTKPNQIKDIYTKLVFYDDNKLKIDNGSADVQITEADGLVDNITAGTGITTSTSSGETTISVASTVVLDTENIDGGTFI